MTGKKKLGQKRVLLLTSAQVSPAIGGNVLLGHYTILNFCGNAPVWLCDSGHDISAGVTVAQGGNTLLEKMGYVLMLSLCIKKYNECETMWPMPDVI
ncbi:hypothetical protein [Pectobacterium aroidearum]|uniref:hypothetical protein n=1 Tax=Pectobacterium aroidearum TaxID=1201031 RepID=UPI0032EE2E1C